MTHWFTGGVTLHGVVNSILLVIVAVTLYAINSRQDGEVRILQERTLRLEITQ